MAPPDYESRWRERWKAEGVGRIADLDAVAAGDVFYNMVEFPYPSASGLHVGHVFKYSGADAYGRYQRMRGKAAFQPMGGDLSPAEVAARAGFSDQSQFSQHFKRLVGVTPGQFRTPARIE